jgi:hypothetical protein
MLTAGSAGDLSDERILKACEKRPKFGKAKEIGEYGEYHDCVHRRLGA